MKALSIQQRDELIYIRRVMDTARLRLITLRTDTVIPLGCLQAACVLEPLEHLYDAAVGYGDDYLSRGL